MAFTNYESKEINCKILYFGARGAGKSENLRALLKQTSKELQAGMIEMGDGGGHESSHYFEFLPVSIGHVGKFHFKMHLYILPMDGLYETVNSVILKGLDGLIFVCDSRIEAMPQNASSLTQMKRILREEGYHFPDLPLVIQYNKRDRNNVVSVPLLRQELNSTAVPDHEAVATEARGTLETLQSMSKLILQKLATT